MGLLFADTNIWQDIQNGLAFDFQLSCQIVDSNLAHPSYVSPISAKRSLQPHGIHLTRALALQILLVRPSGL